jgi:hypothetical protein
VAGIEGLTLHGLRRSFKSLTEWLEIPAGVVAQIMGHKPSATAEKHYTVRPLDLLRLHHEKIEAWILEQAGVSFVAISWRWSRVSWRWWPSVQGSLQNCYKKPWNKLKQEQRLIAEKLAAKRNRRFQTPTSSVFGCAPD